jgi:hypothetical protein
VRTLLAILSLEGLLLLANCAAYPTSSGVETPQYPPFPSTKSILPLAIGNTWTYSLTAYDSLGRTIVPARGNLNLALPGGYGLVGDTQLVALTWQNYRDSFSEYMYTYEWDQRDSGALVVHHGDYALGHRGLYVAGWYSGTVTHLFPAEKLWLAYPADSGSTWAYAPDSSGDTASAVIMEVISTHASFFVPDAQSMAAGRFIDCYLYKETGAGYESYYYYSPDIGCVGYCRYTGDKLRETYILTGFAQGSGRSQR